MKGMNSLTISGNVTRDAELKTTPGGTIICSFSVAVNESRKNSEGEREDYPNFINCTMFGRFAEVMAPRLLKGTPVTVLGRIHQDRWQDNDGNNRSSVVCYVDNIQVGARRESSSTSGGSSQPAYPAGDLYDEDVPF